MFTVREATPDDAPAIKALIGEMIPGVDVAARWRWLYDTNPGGKALTWMALEDGEVAGCTSFFPFRLQLDGEVVRAALGGDGYVRPKFRRRGLGGLLHDASRQAMASHAIGCMYGAPGAMNLTPLKHGGSRELGTVARFVRPLRIGGFSTAMPTRYRLDPMIPSDARIDTVWERARGDLRLASVRDSAFYTWRFLEAPAQHEPPFVIMAPDGTPLGGCALETMNGGRELHIVDLFAAAGRWHTCLGAITAHAAATTRAQIVSIKLFSLDGRRRQMWRSGFLERDAKPFLCMIPRDGDRRFLDPMRWFYCGADSDLDRLD